MPPLTLPRSHPTLVPGALTRFPVEGHLERVAPLGGHRTANSTGRPERIAGTPPHA